MLQDLISTALSVFMVLVIISIFWYLLWKYVLSVNPLVIDFFDLEDEKKNKQK
jgi:hypothetical protein